MTVCTLIFNQNDDYISGQCGRFHRRGVRPGVRTAQRSEFLSPRIQTKMGRYVPRTASRELRPVSIDRQICRNAGTLTKKNGLYSSTRPAFFPLPVPSVVGKDTARAARAVVYHPASLPNHTIPGKYPRCDEYTRKKKKHQEYQVRVQQHEPSQHVLTQNMPLGTRLPLLLPSLPAHVAALRQELDLNALFTSEQSDMRA